ncbi:hypothetical protein PMZ80_005616 [Knufia obscura]|uniref:Uncharacterized protein n=1 Tax=Knufia obscura TaxID=1635080 RepID=A0ABR0RM37_9EURO|nr:hypothetical protein PMZ80_005616 [Knufia obscura]
MKFTAVASLSLLSLAGATPIISVPTPEEIYAMGHKRSEALEARDAYNTYLCTKNDCGDCPVFFGLGSGYPDCPVYDSKQFVDSGLFNHTENGQLTVFFDFPQPDEGCKYIIRTGVIAGDSTCGAPSIVVEAAQCVRATLESAFFGQFCCGTGDCGAAGLPTAMAGSSSGGFNLILSANGTTLEPQVHDPVTKERRDLSADELSLVKRHTMKDVVKRYASPEPVPEAAPAPVPAVLTKRKCGNGDFTITKPRYERAGQTKAVSRRVKCANTSICRAVMSEEVTQTWEVNTHIDVSDILDIITWSVGFSYSKSMSRSFQGIFDLGEGEGGYVAFTPILSCVQGYFDDDCDHAGDVFEACTPTKSDGRDGEMVGELRAVIVRS